MGLALSGLASGIDWQSIVDQLIEVSRVPQNRLRIEKSELSTKTSVLNEIKTKLGDLKTSVASLGSNESLLKKTASIANSSSDWTSSADSDAIAGNYTFNVTQLATQTVLRGTRNIGAPLNTGDLVTSLPVGRTITAGTFTVNGVELTIDPTDTFQDVLNKITANVPGVTATYNGATDRVRLSGATTLFLGASNDTSNFLEAMRLFNNGGTVVDTALDGTNLGHGLGAARLSGPLDSANLSGIASGSGTIQINGQSINYDTTTDSLQDVLDRISNSSAGVTATYDFMKDRVVLTNQSTGNTAIAVGTTGDTSGLATALGLTGLGAADYVLGQNAQVQVNGGGVIQSKSNTFDESVHGISGLSVTANSTGSETVQVAGDTAAAKEAINDFISKFNTVQNTIEKYTKVTTNDGQVTAAIFSNNRELSDISRSLRQLLYQTGAGVTGSVQRIVDMGIDFDGIRSTISIDDSSLLDSKLSGSIEDVISYLNTDTTGLVARLDSYLDRLVTDSGSANGTLETQLDTISNQSKSLDNQIAQMERQLEQQRSLLESSFIAMERAQATYQQQATYLSNTFNKPQSK